MSFKVHLDPKSVTDGGQLTDTVPTVYQRAGAFIAKVYQRVGALLDNVYQCAEIPAHW